MRKLVQVLVVSALFAAFFLLDPFSLRHSQVQFTYDATEMRAAIEGRWKLSVQGRDLTLDIHQSGDPDVHAERSFVRGAEACGRRTLIRSADACADYTAMPLRVEIVAGAEAGELSRGVFLVYATTFSHGQLELRLGGETSVEATVLPDGSARDLLGATALVRLAR